MVEEKLTYAIQSWIAGHEQEKPWIYPFYRLYESSGRVLANQPKVAVQRLDNFQAHSDRHVALESLPNVCPASDVFVQTGAMRFLIFVVVNSYGLTNRLNDPKDVPTNSMNGVQYECADTHECKRPDHIRVPDEFHRENGAISDEYFENLPQQWIKNQKAVIIDA